MSDQRGRSTTAVHGVPHRRAEWSPVAPSIVQSATFVNPVGSDEHILYAGYGNTPSQVALAKKYAALEGAEDAIFVASGMAATALAHLAVLRPGDHLIASRWIYGGTQRLFDEELARFGITITYVTPDEPRLWRKSVRKETRAVFVETPTNPLLRVLDLGPILKVAKEFGLALLVDGTFASPINFRPLEHGADVVITSATKYLNGHSDAIAGAVAGSASAQCQRSRGGSLGDDPEMDREGALPGTRVASRPRGRGTGAGRLRRHGRAAARGRHPGGRTVSVPASGRGPRAQSRRGREPDLGAAHHLARPSLARAARSARLSGWVRAAELRD